MGPRPFSRGRSRFQFADEVLLRGFNGASTFQSRKGGNKVYMGAGTAPLQWGLDLSVEEGAIGTGNNEVSPIASMGPRPFSRGRHRAVFQDHARQDLLQWGLDLSVEEGA